VIDYNSGTPAREAVPEENSPDHLSDPRLTATAKLILLYVHHHGDPGTAALAKALGVGRSSVAKARASLIETVGYKRVSIRDGGISIRDGGISIRDGRMALPSRIETVSPQKSRIETGVSRFETVESLESRIETVEPAPPLVPPSVPLPGPLPLTPPLSPPREDIVGDATRPVAGVSARGGNKQQVKRRYPEPPESFKAFGAKVRTLESDGSPLTADLLWDTWKQSDSFRRAWKTVPEPYWEAARVVVTTDPGKVTTPVHYLERVAVREYERALKAKAEREGKPKPLTGDEILRLDAERRARDEARDMSLREASFAMDPKFEEYRARMRETQGA
jgi:hypothetical protein